MPARRLALLLALLVPAGCRNTLSDQNDALRRQVMDMEREIDALRARERELEAALAAPDGRDTDLVALHGAHVIDISLGRLSHARDSTGDGRPDTLVVYVSPRDGRGRFTQAVATVTAHAGLLPGSGDAVTLGRVQLDPATFRDAYRSGVVSTHYTLEFPIDVPEPTPTSCLLSVELRDHATGNTHVASRSVDLEPN